jgi:hypothetical protein
MQISTIGIDIGKNYFHFVGFDARGGIGLSPSLSNCPSSEIVPRCARADHTV